MTSQPNGQHYTTIFVDSNQRSSGTSSAFTYNLKQLFTGIRRLDIKRVMIPHSWYGVTSLNNTFLVGSTTVTIPVGNYNYLNFPSVLTTALVGAGLTGYSASFNQYNYLLTITSGAANFTMTIGSLAGQLLGFTAGTVTGAATYTGTNAINLCGPLEIYLVSNELAGATDSRAIFQGVISSVVAVVPVSAYGGDTCSKRSFTIFDYQKKPDVLGRCFQTIDFSLIDTNGNPINLNGLPYSIELRCWCENIPK